MWDSDWADAHARLADLRTRLGPMLWQAVHDAVTDIDRVVIDQLLNGEFDS